ncbi:MAG: ABC transporter ATP-binding protein [Candidatus Fermentibacteraceae bacterium]
MTPGLEAVEVADIRKSFKTVEAVRGISFSVGKGEVFGLVGPDGAGKTTTMRMLAAVLTPDSGSVSILGLDSVRDRERIHDRIAYMSQRFGLYQDLTVVENMEFYAELYGVSRKALKPSVEKLLKWSSLAPFRNRPAGKLSGGMKQKLGLACALVHTPELLILDEPTNGVDPVSRREFWELLYNLVKEGLGIVLTTAYLDEAERCHRLAFMDGGCITATGTPGEIVDLIPGGVRSFRSKSPFEDSRRLEEIPGALSTVFGKEVHVMGNVNSSLIEAALGRKMDVHPVKASVEDAFVYLSSASHG